MQDILRSSLENRSCEYLSKMANESEYPDLKQYFLQTSTGSKVCAYTSQPSGGSNGKPTLIFIHGYPQSYVCFL